MLNKILEKSLRHFIHSDFDGSKLVLLLSPSFASSDNGNGEKEETNIMLIVKLSKHYAQKIDHNHDNEAKDHDQSKRFQLKVVYPYVKSNNLFFDNYDIEQTMSFVDHVTNNDGYRVASVHLFMPSSANHRRSHQGCCLYLCDNGPAQ